MNDIRTQLEELGLSQSGLARTFKLYNDPREFDVILRWVQRAVAGGVVDNVPYLKVMLSILRGNTQLRADLQRQLDLLSSGKMRSHKNVGLGPEDTTAESIERLVEHIERLDGLLIECAPGTSLTAGKQTAAAHPPARSPASTLAAQARAG